MTERRANTRWKVIGSRILLGLYCLSLPLSLVAIWANNLVLDTDVYVDTVAPLAADPDIQEAIATRLTDFVSGRIQRDGAT